MLIAAPHTSNWDAIYMLAAAAYFRITLRWMGKASLTKGPFGWVVSALGCVPIDRSARHDVVEPCAAPSPQPTPCCSPCRPRAPAA